MPEMTLLIEGDTIHFPEEIENTHETLKKFYSFLEDFGIELEGNEETLEQRVLRHSLCG